MHKKLTITLDEAVYKGLRRTVGRQCISQSIEDLVRPYVLNSLDEGYRAMAEDKTHEAEATEWCHALATDLTDEAR